MSTRYKTAFERGRFFIETGTPQSFLLFWKNQNTGLIRRIPQWVFNKVHSHMTNGDKDAAVTLWQQACVSADLFPIFLLKRAVVLSIKTILVGMILWSFIRLVQM